MNKLEDTVRSCCDSVNIASIYLTGWQIPPHYPMPAIQTGTNSLIAWLWVNVKRTKRNNKKLMQWYLALCFDKHGHYTG